MNITLSQKKPEHTTLVRFDPARDFSCMERDVEGTQTLVLGIESMVPVTNRRLRMLARTVIQEAKAKQVTMLTLMGESLTLLPGIEGTQEEIFAIVVENTLLAAYEFTHYKQKPKHGWRPIEEVVVVGVFDAATKLACKRAEIVAKEVNACRDLSNMPGGDMTPAILATRIKTAAKGTLARVTVLSLKDMEILKMGAVLGVARGAKEPPNFIIVEYWGGKKKDAPTVLVGKGVTYDTGGLSLKPTSGMLDMHLDMSGGAAVAHAVIAAARLKLKVNVIALIPAVENAISNDSYRPGDVLRSMSGKTIDVLDTDAEGRIILADALTYAKRYHPKLVVDVATLTGAALVTFGTKACAVLSKDDALAQRICRLGEESGDYCWSLPLWEEYQYMVKGRFGDVANIPTESARYAGTIGGGMFLAEFADGYPWVHIDMAPRMTSDRGDQLAPGAAGVPVRLLIQLLAEQEAPA